MVSENEECKLFVAWANKQPRVGEYLIKNVNEGKRSFALAKMLKAMGMRAGVPDYHLPIPNKKYHGLWIEMKRKELEGKKNPNKFQDEWLDKLNAIGHYACYAYGCYDAIAVTIAYLNDKL